MTINSIQFGQIKLKDALRLSPGARVKDQNGKIYELAQESNVSTDKGDAVTRVVFHLRQIVSGKGRQTEAVYADSPIVRTAEFYHADSVPVRAGKQNADVDKRWTVVG
ncbi:MAG: hypothetical protein VKJ04_06420 [Vampirovibrionales bacterium]|nr:hypothetical protein [Vampirovibrionales bacterium]